MVRASDFHARGHGFESCLGQTTHNILSRATSGRALQFSVALGQYNGSSKGASNLTGYPFNTQMYRSDTTIQLIQGGSGTPQYISESFGTLQRCIVAILFFSKSRPLMKISSQTSTTILKGDGYLNVCLKNKNGSIRSEGVRSKCYLAQLGPSWRGDILVFTMVILSILFRCSKFHL